MKYLKTFEAYLFTHVKGDPAKGEAEIQLKGMNIDSDELDQNEEEQDEDDEKKA